METNNSGNPSIKMYVNKREIKNTFKIKTGYYLEFLTSKTMNYLEALKVTKIRMKMQKICLIYKLLK